MKSFLMNSLIAGLPLLFLPYLMATSSVGQFAAVDSSKINRLVISTLEKLETEGITPANAGARGLQRTHTTSITRFDAEGRYGLQLKVTEVSASLLGKLAGTGGNVVLTLPAADIILVYLPIDKIIGIADWDEVQYIRPIVGGTTNTGSVRSEGDSLHHARIVRSELNVKGDSIRIGVISDGCASWQTAQDSGDLPSGFDSSNFHFSDPFGAYVSKIGSGDEGTAMMEIIHDLAPEADIYFYGALGDPAGSAAHVDAIYRLAREKGCKVIVDDLTWFDQPMFEDGTPATNWTVAAAAQWAIDTGIVYVSSAGNSANGPPNFITRSHYQANYSDINPGSNFPGMKPLPNGPIPAGYPSPWDNVHDFKGGVPPTDAGLKLIILPAVPDPILTIVLEWNDPWGGPPTDFDLYLYDGNLVVQKGASTNIQPASPPWEIIQHANPYPFPETLTVLINQFMPGPPSLLGLYIYGDNWVEYFSPQNSIWGQPGISDVIAVGAVPQSNTTTIEPFSSRGTYDVYFPVPVIRPKPDLVAVDGVQISGAGGFSNPFFGTSASAPHVAAMAALLLSKCPALSPQQVKAKIERTAVDLGVPGFDAIFGNGFADIERALLEVDTTIGTLGPYTMSSTVGTPAFFASSSGYAVNTITVTGGTVLPTTMSSSVSVSSGSPFVEAGVINLGCPAIPRWYEITQSGGTATNYSVSITSYLSESERSLAGIQADSLQVIHWNGAYFDILPVSNSPVKIGNTWKLKTSYPNADLSPFFIGYLARGVNVITTSGVSAKADTTVGLTFNVGNTGNGWDTLSIHVFDSQGWMMVPGDSAFSVVAGETTAVTIMVTIPPEDTIGTVDSVWIVAASIADTDVRDSSFATVTIIPAYTVSSVELLPGWNMVSVPLHMTCYAKDTLFPQAVSDAFVYEHGYLPCDSLVYGKGYWVKMSDSIEIEFHGQPCYEESVTVIKGWNMIGAVTVPILVTSIASDPGGLVTSSFFHYEGIYEEADTLEPGNGYWVKVSGEGRLILSSGTEHNAGTLISIVVDSEKPPFPPDDGEAKGKTTPDMFGLEQNYPNPFNPVSVIRYQLPVNSFVTLKIYDVLGQEVSTLVSGIQDAGYGSIEWNAGSVSSGIYFYRLDAVSISDPSRTYMRVKKMMVIK